MEAKATVTVGLFAVKNPLTVPGIIYQSVSQIEVSPKLSSCPAILNLNPCTFESINNLQPLKCVTGLTIFVSVIYDIGRGQRLIPASELNSAAVQPSPSNVNLIY
jgi:hypothetical protein